MYETMTTDTERDRALLLELGKEEGEEAGVARSNCLGMLMLSQNSPNPNNIWRTAWGDKEEHFVKRGPYLRIEKSLYAGTRPYRNAACRGNPQFFHDDGGRTYRIDLPLP